LFDDAFIPLLGGEGGALATEEGVIPPHITDLANQRLVAKAEKNYALADELRNQIQEQGYSIKDIP